VWLLATFLGSCEAATTGPADGGRLESLTPTLVHGIVGREITPVPSVRVTNRTGDPVSGVIVYFAASGDGTVASKSTKTDRTGVASAGMWSLGRIAGLQTLTASSTHLPPVVFSVTAQPGPAAELIRLSGNNQVGLAGAPLAEILRLKVADLYGNTITPAVVSFSIVFGNGSIETVSEARIDGVVESGVWTLGPTPGLQQVRAEAGGFRTTFTATACASVCAPRQLLIVRAGHVYLMDLSVPGASKLTDDASGRESEPAWSPDGRRIAFVRYTSNWTPRIFLTSVDGSAERLRIAGFGSPAWSPDGRLLAVDSGGCVYYCDVYVLRVDDEDAEPVHLATSAAQPAWSPDGKKIAFVSLSGDDGYHALHVMNADGSGITPVTARDPGAIYRPTWSPDGRRIAFAKCISGRCDIFVVDANGSGLAQLTRGASTLTPAWSPNSNWIAFGARARGAVEASLRYIDADGGGEPVPIGEGDSPAWRPLPAGRQ